MPLDLVIGISTLTGLSLLAFHGGRHFHPGNGRTIRPGLLVVSLLAALAFSWSLAGKLQWAAWLPIASVLLWCNLMPLLLSFAAGLASRTRGFIPWHRGATVAALLSLAAGYTITPIARPLLAPVETDPTASWCGDACLQTHPSTCAPAAAATLLRSAGVPGDERTLAETCLTSSAGTEPLGLFRGLAIASDRHLCRPRVASRDPNQWRRRDQLPNVALVRFSESPVSGSLPRFLGPRDEGHAIVVCDRDAKGNWVIEDPAFGRTTWTDPQFRKRFTGDAIYLAARFK